MAARGRGRGRVLLVAGAVALRAAAVAPGPAVVLPTPAPSGPVAPLASPTAPAEVVVDVVGAVAAPGRGPARAGIAGGRRDRRGGWRDRRRAGQRPQPRAACWSTASRSRCPRPGEQAGDGGGAASAGADDLVDLNSADAAALDALPGIGPVLAERIVAHREDGPFTTVDELADVAGIGPTLLERLRDLVRV